MALNPKQRTFVNEYIKTKNVTKAALKAGFAKKAASSQGSRLLKNAKVAAEIKRIMDGAAEKAELSAAEVLAEIRKLAFVDNTEAFDADGCLLPFSEMSEANRKSIVGMETEEIMVGRGSKRVTIGKARKIKNADKVRALEMLAKHFKLLTDVHEHQGKGGGPIAFVALPPNGSEAEGVPSPSSPFLAPPEADGDSND